jgi:hypothetical protein
MSLFCILPGVGYPQVWQEFYRELEIASASFAGKSSNQNLHEGVWPLA